MRISGATPSRLAIAIGFFLAGLLLPLSARAEIERRLTVQAPTVVVAGSVVEITIAAGTNATDGEKVVYMQAEYSVDGGRRWQIGLWEDLLGAEGTRRFQLTAGAAGTTVLVRVRVAFRGGLAGAVDFRGGAIRWFDTWRDWRTPPARSVEIQVEGS